MLRNHILRYSVALFVVLAVLFGTSLLVAQKGGTKPGEPTAEARKPVVYLTFDDGPDPQSTPLLLSILRQENVKATFFLVGKLVDGYPDLTREIVADGHLVGNHTYTHPHMAELSPQQQQDQILRTSNAIEHWTNVWPTYFRYPYGEPAPYAESQLKSWGLEASVYWSYSPRDWYPECPDTGMIVKRILDSVHSGTVLLLHDSPLCKNNLFQYLRPVIDELREKWGYTFGLVNDGRYPHTPSSVAENG